MNKTLAFLLAVSVPVAADEDTFRERFADPETRAAAIAELVPGTRDAYFHTALQQQLTGKDADFRSGTLDMNGSKEVVELISKTPGAIGYSGMGYLTAGVKQLKVSRKKGEPGVAPSVAATLDRTYPIARALYMYLPGDPPPHVQQYLDWILSPAGQAIVKETGYVPVK